MIHKLIIKHFFFVSALLLIACSKHSTINRFDLVNRHNIIHQQIDPLNSLTVGNGRFAFTADITGMQTFPEVYEKGIPLGTFSDWGWHSFPNPDKFELSDVVKNYEVGNQQVPYYYQFDENTGKRPGAATKWLRENPHRLHLGIIGLKLLKSDASLVSIDDIHNPEQQLNLLTGEMTSYFEIEGIPVHVITFCDQQNDRVLFDIESDLIQTGQLAVQLRFPYPMHEKFNSGHDFTRDDEHNSLLLVENEKSSVIRHDLNDTHYFTTVNWAQEAEIVQEGKHHFVLKPGVESGKIQFSVLFTDAMNETGLPGFAETSATGREHWKIFWETGGAVDFSGSSDARAHELERRVVLSQYLTKIQCTGIYPPQETGLTYNSWHGKFHLEMHWWHGVHFLLWQRPQLIEKQLDYYYSIFDKAHQTANLQGYKGVRWPKMIDPSGSESPSSVGVFLIWQQPHLIYFADLLYCSNNNDPAIIDRFEKLVFATADFMASYARFDSLRNEYVLGPALIPAQERFKPETTINPAFELAYWYLGLETAQLWRERKGLPREKKWQQVLDQLSPLPQADGLYLFTESAPDSYQNLHYLTDHPMVLGLLGMLPKTPMIDKAVMANTLKAIVEKWQWETCWGWDFPMAAMNACALDQPELAMDLLMMKTIKNRYLMNGHNYQNDHLSLYLPGNGGLLSAVALLCTYRNENGQNGFPRDGTWQVKYENLNPMW